jgi:hypothetical protein
MPISGIPLALANSRRNGLRNALLAQVWWVQGRRVCCTVKTLLGIGKTRRPRPRRSLSIGLGDSRHSINPLHSARRGRRPIPIRQTPIIAIAVHHRYDAVHLRS